MRPASDIELTAEERRAIAALKRLAKRWPPRLWLFANGTALHVVVGSEEGVPVMGPGGCVDQDRIVDSVDIPNDGGGF